LNELHNAGESFQDFFPSLETSINLSLSSEPSAFSTSTIRQEQKHKNVRNEKLKVLRRVKNKNSSNEDFDGGHLDIFMTDQVFAK
jgi:hypothetical protein